MHYLTKTAQKIFQVLIDAPFKEFKEIELINAARTGKGATGKLIDNLIKDNILKARRAGKTKLISLHLTNLAVFSLKNLFALEKLHRLPKPRLAAVLLFNREVQPATSLLILFGSTTTGTATSASDIDLLVVSQHIPKVELARKKVEESLGIRLNLHLYDESEIKNKLKEDSFLQNVLFQGVILSGYNLTLELYRSLEKDELNLARIFYFQERIRAARRNYLQKDHEGTGEIMAQLQEQLIFYLLSHHKIPYESKKDAAEKIKKLPEAKKLFQKVQLKEKIDILDVFVQNILINQLIGEEKDGATPRN
jgi:predicted nucleotidyltransferase